MDDEFICGVASERVSRVDEKKGVGYLRICNDRRCSGFRILAKKVLVTCASKLEQVKEPLKKKDETKCS